VFEGGPPRRYHRSMPTSPEFVVELPLFSGPFRLLADLVLDQRMDVCDVPVAGVTDRFMKEGLDRIEGWSLEESTWFVAVCAILLELKVGRLLPRPEPTDEEDLLGGARPDLAYARSLELAAFRRVAAALAEKMAAASLMAPRNAGPPKELSHLYPDVLENVAPDDVRAVAAAVLAPPKDLDLSHVTTIHVSLADAMDAVREQMMGRQEARFRDLIDGCKERIEVVVRFLALLELHREGKVELAQAHVFGDIEVRWQGSTRDGREAEGGVG
jgi:segregation and condensation protein A